MNKILFLLFCFNLCIPSFAEETKFVAHPSGFSFSQLGKVPIQTGGRIKPLLAFAQDSVLLITGKTNFKDWDPLELLFSWIAYPFYWEEEAFIKVSNKELLRQLLLDESRSVFSPKELLENNLLSQYAQSLAGDETGETKQVMQSVHSQPEPREQELKRLLEKLTFFRSLTQGQAWTIVPEADSEKPWGAILDAPPEESIIRSRFIETLKSYYDGDKGHFEESAQALNLAITEQVKDWDTSSPAKLKVEYFYIKSDLFGLAFLFYLFAAFFWIGAQAVTNKESVFTKIAWGLTGFGFFTHVLGFAARIYIAGRPPVSNMYESVVWVSFGILVFALIIFKLHKQKVVLAAGTFVSGACLYAAHAAPAIMDPSIQPLVPVLRSNFWLTIHVLSITLGYAAFALSLGLGNIALFRFWQQAIGKITEADGLKKITIINQLSYRSIQFGVVLLAAGTILGGVWADYSWGRFWGWDPKETWALIALLVYLAVLHGRFTGWVSPFNFAVLSVLSFVSVLMAWYGVNFILGVGLHSYGFSSGGTTGVTLYVGLQTAFVVWVSLLRKSSLRRLR